MKKSRAKPKSSLDWIQQVDPEDIAAAYDESTTDAYGDDEQHTGLLTSLGDELQFPFKGKTLGQQVQNVAMEWPEADEYGLDLLVEIEGEQHRIAAQSIQVLPPFPDGIAFLAAYLDWRRRF